MSSEHTSSTSGSIITPHSGRGRRVVLVDLFWTRDKDPRVPLGHASLLTALRSRTGVDVHSVVIPVNDSEPVGRASTAIRALTAGLSPRDVDVAVGVYVWAEDQVQELLPRLRREGFRGRIILGGPQISYAGAGLDLVYRDADAFVRGYGEDALCVLAVTPGTPQVVGVHYPGHKDIEVQASVDLGALPSPWLDGAVPLQGQRFVRWETQRGCQFRCSFCQHREAGARLLRRDLAAGRIAQEVDLFCRLGIQSIAVLDPIFNAGSEAIAVLRRFAERGFKGRLSLQCRAELVTEEFLEAAGVLDVCLEFGLQTIHDDEGRAVRRMNDVGKVSDVLAEVRRRGLDHEVSLIFGLPRQTLASFEQTVAWCLARRVPVVKAFPLLLLRGTALDRRREEWGLVAAAGAMQVVVKSTTFDRRDWVEMARVSEALSHTEGRHPLTLEDLLAEARTREPVLARWVS
ncbi:MAG: hypothetical protein AMXMBFR64_14470 [Myxococcales bacterium]